MYLDSQNTARSIHSPSLYVSSFSFLASSSLSPSTTMSKFTFPLYMKRFDTRHPGLKYEFSYHFPQPLANILTKILLSFFAQLKP